MIRRFADNRITGDPAWSYETLAYEASVVENMLYNAVLYKKKHGKTTYIAIRGADGKAVVSVKVQDSDLYTINGCGRIGCLVLCRYAYKIRFSSFDNISIIPVE